MLTGNFERVKKEIEDAIKKSNTEEDVEHSKRVLKHLLRLRRSAGEELQIAALAHDIDRAVKPRTQQKKGESYDSYKKRHAERSARITAKLMKKYGYSNSSIEKVKSLIQNHETGGDAETNNLTDADSISYFDYNVELYLKREGSEAARKKIKFMYTRASPRARRCIHRLKFSAPVKRMLEDAIKDIKGKEAKKPRKNSY